MRVATQRALLRLDRFTAPWLRKVARTLGLDGDQSKRALIRALAEHPGGWSQRALESLSASDLRALARQLQLPVRGPRGDLIARLLGATDLPPPRLTGVAYERLFESALAEMRRYELRGYQREAVDTICAKLDPAQPILLNLAVGGGKTLTANEVVVARLRAGAKRVLWVAKDWALLRQAAFDLGCRHPDLRRQLRRLGGDASVLHPLPELSGSEPAVIYVTSSTLQQRIPQRGQTLPGGLPSLVVKDEAHYGEDAKTGRAIRRWCERHRIPLLGLTATPRPESPYKVVYRRGFQELVDQGALARPDIEELATCVSWEPARLGSGDFTGTSLQQLEHDARNTAIVGAVRERGLGQTIIFAVNIRHADALARLLQRQGCAAAALHSGRHDFDNARQVARFARGELQVLVNVEMLTHGIDIPSVESIVMARPTLSERLYMQMLGRGARKAPGKDSFRVVEVTDNLTRFQADVITARRVFRGAGRTSQDPPEIRPRKLAPRLDRHHYDRRRQPIWTTSAAAAGEARDLWLHEGQTFGVEIELTSDELDLDGLCDAEPEALESWVTLAEIVRGAVTEAVDPALVVSARDLGWGADPEHLRWSVVYDSSCGLEVVSRVLSGDAGLLELQAVLEALTELTKAGRVRVNWRCGLHVHLGWKPEEGQLASLLQLVHVLEPGLAQLVAPSRIAHFDGRAYDPSAPSEWARPISSAFGPRLRKASNARILSQDDRYLTVNVSALKEHGTVEVRMHSGTTDPAKVLPWISLWMQILHRAERGDVPQVGGRRETLRPFEDLHRLMREADLPGSDRASFRERLEARRREVLEAWRRI